MGHIKRILCWFGWHDWEFTLVHIEPDDDGYGYERRTYTGVCKRCGDRDIFFD